MMTSTELTLITTVFLTQVENAYQTKRKTQTFTLDKDLEIYELELNNIDRKLFENKSISELNEMVKKQFCDKVKTTPEQIQLEATSQKVHRADGSVSLFFRISHSKKYHIMQRDQKRAQEKPVASMLDQKHRVETITTNFTAVIKGSTSAAVVSTASTAAAATAIAATITTAKPTSLTATGVPVPFAPLHRQHSTHLYDIPIFSTVEIEESAYAFLMDVFESELAKLYCGSPSTQLQSGFILKISIPLQLLLKDRDQLLDLRDFKTIAEVFPERVIKPKYNLTTLEMEMIRSTLNIVKHDNGKGAVDTESSQFVFEMPLELVTKMKTKKIMKGTNRRSERHFKEKIQYALEDKATREFINKIIAQLPKLLDDASATYQAGTGNKPYQIRFPVYPEIILSNELKRTFFELYCLKRLHHYGLNQEQINPLKGTVQLQQNEFVLEIRQGLADIIIAVQEMMFRQKVVNKLEKEVAEAEANLKQKSENMVPPTLTNTASNATAAAAPAVTTTFSAFASIPKLRRTRSAL